MVFSSIVFLFYFLPIILLLYYVVPRKGKNGVLFLCSLVFYAWGEPVYLFLMLFSIVCNFSLGLLLDRSIKKAENGKGYKEPKMWLFFAVALNIGLLAFFKYADFLIQNSNLLLNTQIKPLLLPLPLGISFYTFQAMSYLIDLYRRKVNVQKNFIDFGTYVALFPQLIAGPIVRFSDIAFQLRERKESWDLFANGVVRFMIGLSKKVLLANNAGIVFDQVAQMQGSSASVLSVWIGILMFTFQIYFDFSGYSDTAIGLGKMFGFSFPENFDHPYTSKSITEFWRRWHMTLGTWFREYVYIPLGGNRNGLKRQIFNLFVVWTLTGIWHGASWNFVIWGLYFGVLLVLEKLFLLNWLKKMPLIIQHGITFFLVMMSWVIFSFDSIEQISWYFQSLFAFNGNIAIDSQGQYLLKSNFILLIVMSFGVTTLPQKMTFKIRAFFKGKGYRLIFYCLLQTIIIIALFFLVIAYLVSSSYNPFLYFRF
ncbi:MBOAT family O-acyltransferase [Anaerovorax sp. IOR16]|uniref:MBOAT family O-acyltransferase n=1 Tax=Anaerovorax sp. IOR16 TaxID=2773458 RepID=UPI0019D250BF|nr:MBOAT family O-acyltransferase [Anaerovorax sp. IOR16]